MRPACTVRWYTMSETAAAMNAPQSFAALSAWRVAWLSSSRTVSVDGFAAVFGEGQGADVHAGTQSQERTAGQPLSLVAHQRRIESAQQRVHESRQY